MSEIDTTDLVSLLTDALRAQEKLESHCSHCPRCGLSPKRALFETTAHNNSYRCMTWWDLQRRAKKLREKALALVQE